MSTVNSGNLYISLKGKVYDTQGKKWTGSYGNHTTSAPSWYAGRKWALAEWFEGIGWVVYGAHSTDNANNYQNLGMKVVSPLTSSSNVTTRNGDQPCYGVVCSISSTFGVGTSYKIYGVLESPPEE